MMQLNIGDFLFTPLFEFIEIPVIKFFSNVLSEDMVIENMAQIVEISGPQLLKLHVLKVIDDEMILK